MLGETYTKNWNGLFYPSMQELFLNDPLHYDLRLQLCCRKIKIFGSFSHLLSPFDFQHFSVFYGILLKFLRLLFLYPNFKHIRNLICYFPSRFTSNIINIIKTKC